MTRSRYRCESSYAQYGLHALQCIRSHDLAVTLSCVDEDWSAAAWQCPAEYPLYTYISFLIGERVPVGQTHLLDDRTVCVASLRQLAAALHCQARPGRHVTLSVPFPAFCRPKSKRVSEHMGRVDGALAPCACIAIACAHQCTSCTEQQHLDLLPAGGARGVSSVREGGALGPLLQRIRLDAL